jgi:hypothetical protein
MSDAQPKTPIPWALVTACLSLLASFGLIVGGVYVLAGLGWALVAGAVPCLLLSAVIVRGLK